MLTSSKATNPYIAGTPVRGEHGFFGRQDILEWVTSELRNPSTNSLVLSGQRRIGKTTLLLQLERYLPRREFLPIYFDLQNQATNPLGKVLSDLADKVAEVVGFQPPAENLFDNEGLFFQRTFLPGLYKMISPECRPVFLFDEFDVLDLAAKDLPETIASRALFPFLRTLMGDARLAFIFVVGRQVQDLSMDSTSAFKTSLMRDIWLLDNDGSENLVRQAEKNGTLQYSDTAVTRIYELANGHPYLTQLLCQRIWQRAYGIPTATTPEIDADKVNTAVGDALETGGAALTWLWDGLSPAEKIYAAAFAEIASERQTIPEDRVIQVISANANRLRRGDVERAPSDLIKRKILVQDGERLYRFAVELFHRWVQVNKPLERVKDEIDRIEPVADRLFSLGRDFYNRHKWDEASRFFRDALQQNPLHFGARLLLGECLLSLNLIDEAVTELDQAYQLDNQEAKYSFARALIAQANHFDKKGHEDGAIKVCEQILKFSPNETQARELLVQIWMRRGDAAVKKDDLDAGMIAYKEAGNQEKIASISVLWKKKAQKSFKHDLLAYELAEQWEKALKLIEDAVQSGLFAQDDKEIIERLDFISRQNYLLQLYMQALDDHKNNRSQEAIINFKKVIEINPDFKDVLVYSLQLYKNIDVFTLRAQLNRLTRENNALSTQEKKLTKQLNEANAKALDLTKKVAALTKPGFVQRLMRSTTKAKPPAMLPEKVSAPKLSPPPVAQYVAMYVFGDDLFDDAFSIDTPSGEFLGECGLGMGEVIDVGTPRKVTTFEVWMFDKNDIETVTKNILSAYAFADPNMRAKLEPKGELILAQHRKQIVLQTLTLEMIVTISDMQYVVDTLPPESHFDRITVELAIWRKGS